MRGRREGGDVAYEVQVVRATARPTAVVAQATTWDAFPSLWRHLLDQVYAFLETGDVSQTGHNVMLYKDDVPNVEVGVEVNAAFTSSGPVVASCLPAGEAAMTVHRGPYHLLGAAHQAVRAWCPANGHRIAGPRWEIYGDWHEEPTQLETEVFYLLT
jgi:effector-binding domain-containing protein